MMQAGRSLCGLSLSGRRLLQTGVRSFGSSSAVQAKSLQYERFGSPDSVLKLVDGEPTGSGDVRVQMLVAPVHPADINVMQGVYGSLPSLPAVGGMEGVGEVVEPGSSSFKRGDRVIPKSLNFGSWTTERLCKADELISIDIDIDPMDAAVLSVNPSTGYRLLADFEDLKSGDVVIQNGANSMVGQTVIQLAKAKGVKTINIIREREQIKHAALIERLKGLGGDVVVSSDYANTPEFKKLISDLPAPKLALNCVGGQSATELARNLATGGTLVTYGGMSRRPVQIPTSLLIFKDIKLRGFWLSRWLEQNSDQARKEMLDDLSKQVKEDKLKLFTELHELNQFQAALQRAAEPLKDRKVILSLGKSMHKVKSSKDPIDKVASV